MNDRGNCRSCNAPLLWVYTPEGRRMPLDADPIRRIVIDAASGDKMVGRVRNVYTSHFETCPQASRWRGQGGDNG